MREPHDHRRLRGVVIERTIARMEKPARQEDAAASLLHQAVDSAGAARASTRRRKLAHPPARTIGADPDKNKVLQLLPTRAAAPARSSRNPHPRENNAALTKSERALHSEPDDAFRTCARCPAADEHGSRHQCDDRHRRADTGAAVYPAAYGPASPRASIGRARTQSVGRLSDRVAPEILIVQSYRSSIRALPTRIPRRRVDVPELPDGRRLSSFPKPDRDVRKDSPRG
jgi:hypothetical protein